MPRRSRKRRLPRESEECQLVGTRVSKQPHQRRSARLSQQHDVAEEKANKKVPYKKAETRRGKKQENQHRSDESTERQGAETGPANDPSHPSSAQHRQEVTPEKNVTSLTSSAEYEAEKCVIPDHGEKLLELFCSDCTRALCTKCHIDDHKGHRVQAYRDAIEGKTDEYQTCKEMAVPLLRKLQDQEVELLKMKAEKEKKKCDMEAVTSERFEKEAVDFTTKIKDLGDQIHHHDLEWDKHWGQVGQYRRKIEHHKFEMNRHHSEKNSKMRENEKEKKKVEVIMKLKDKCDSRIRTEFDKDAKMIDDAIKSVVSLRRGIKDNIVYGEALIADKHFRPGLHQDIEKTRNKLQELAGDAEVDRVTDLKAKMSVYSSATRVGRCEIPESEYIVYGVTFVTSDRIAICGCLKMRPPCTVRLWDVTSNVVEVVVEGSDWIRSLAYLGNNTIVSLNMAPVISIIDLNTKNVRGIEVNLDAAIEWLWNVAVDDR